MITAQQVLQTTVPQIGRFDTFQKYINKPENAGTFSEEIGRSMARSLCFDYDNIAALNHMQLAICLGLPSAFQEVNCCVQGFMLNDVHEVVDLFGNFMDEKVVIDLYEHGTNLRGAHERSWAARRFVDMAIYLHTAEQEEIEDASSVCIGFPGMPGMAPLIKQAVDKAQQHLFADGHWYSELVPAGLKEHLYRCIPDTSNSGSVIVPTNCGTVYLSGRPKRGDTNSNHLRPV